MPTHLQPVQPRTLRERLCALFHRHPVTAIPHWDAISLPDFPELDLESEWARLRADLDRMHASGSLDAAHGDVVDRLIHDRRRQWSTTYNQHVEKAQETLNRIEAQGRQHLTRLGNELGPVRQAFDAESEVNQMTWNQLWGHPDAHTPPTTTITTRLPQPLLPLDDPPAGANHNKE